MNEKEKLEFIQEELDAICEDFETRISQLITIKNCFKELIKVAKGIEPSYPMPKSQEEDETSSKEY